MKVKQVCIVLCEWTMKNRLKSHTVNFNVQRFTSKSSYLTLKIRWMSKKATIELSTYMNDAKPLQSTEVNSTLDISHRWLNTLWICLFIFNCFSKNEDIIFLKCCEQYTKFCFRSQEIKYWCHRKPAAWHS